jgi:polysaccharide export outer membrane protein
LARYHGQAVEPEIAVAITSTEARSATVLGNVRNPGRIEIPPRGIRLLDLIASTGGASEAPWEVRVNVQRGSASGSLILSDIVERPGNNIVVLPGDTVNVSHEARRFAVYGGVSRPANIEIPVEDADLAYLLAEVGGLNDRVAQTRSVFVFRPSSGGDMATAYRFDLSRPDALLLAGAFHLEPNDITYVASADAADFQRFVSIVLSPVLGAASATTNLVNE